MQHVNVRVFGYVVVVNCRFQAKLGRYNYITPTSYLELIATFQQLISQKRETIMNAKQRYINGLDQLAFAESEVSFFTLTFMYIVLFL